MFSALGCCDDEETSRLRIGRFTCAGATCTVVLTRMGLKEGSGDCTTRKERRRRRGTKRG